jgi:7,8-dihydroneopterin aldolase/epimerase/oxygenase
MSCLEKIRLNGLQFYAYHGALEEERTLGQIFELDIEVGGEFSRPGRTDDLHWTVDYTLLYREVTEIFNRENFRLLETCAIKIADGLLNKFTAVQEATVKVRKPHVPMGGILKNVEVEVTRRRQNT